MWFRCARLVCCLVLYSVFLSVFILVSKIYILSSLNGNCHSSMSCMHSSHKTYILLYFWVPRYWIKERRNEVETGKWMGKYVTDTILMKKRTSQIGFTPWIQIPRSHTKAECIQVVAAYSFNPSIWEAGVDRSLWVWNQPDL